MVYNRKGYNLNKYSQPNNECALANIPITRFNEAAAKLIALIIEIKCSIAQRLFIKAHNKTMQIAELRTMTSSLT